MAGSSKGKKPGVAPSHLERRGDVYWFRMRIKGKRVAKCLHTTNKREAKRLAGEWEKHFRSRTEKKLPVREHDEPTVKQFGKRWLAEWVNRKRTPKGQKLAKHRLENHINPPLGGNRLSNVTKTDLHAYVSELQGKGLSDQSVKHALADLKCLLNYARELGLLLGVPSFRSVTPKIAEVAPKRLSDDQVDKILKTLIEKQPTYAFAVSLALLTGLRYGELHRLTWQHVKWEPRPHLQLEKTKSKKVRRVPLSQEATRLLRVQYLEAASKALSAHVLPFRCADAGNIYKDCVKRFGFRWNFHQLRHTFACRYLERGGSLAALQEMLGHSSLQMTERYARASESMVFLEAESVNMTTSGRQGLQETKRQVSQHKGSDQ